VQAHDCASLSKKHPTSNIQHPEKPQAPNPKPPDDRLMPRFGALSLKFLWSLVLGVWYFIIFCAEISAAPQFTARAPVA
jgi:hypothetical protein